MDATIFGSKLAGKIMEAIENVLDDDDTVEEIEQSIRDNFDFDDAVKELIEDDEEVEAALQSKVKTLLIKKIEEKDDLEDFFSDEDDMNNSISENINAEGIIEEFMESDTDIKETAKDKIEELLKDEIEGLDEDILPDFDELKALLDVKKLIEEILEDPEVEDTLKEKLKTILDENFISNLDEDDLPEDTIELLNIPTSINEVLADPNFKSVITEKIQESVKTAITLYAQNNIELEEKLKSHPEITRITNQEIKFLLLDKDLMYNVREEIKNRLQNDSSTKIKLVEIMFEAMGTKIVSKLLAQI